MASTRVFVDTSAALRRINQHTDRGGSLRGLAVQAGVAHSTLSRIVTGTYINVEDTVAARILAAPMRPSNLGCLRRLEALATLGHPCPDISDAGGCHGPALYAAWRRGRFTDPLAQAVVAAYGQLEHTSGWDRRIVLLARRRGYAPPRAWVGVDIDNPKSRPLVFGPRPSPRPRGLVSAAYITARTGLPVTREVA